MKNSIMFIGLMCLLFVKGITFGVNEDTSEVEKAEYKQDLTEIQTKRELLNPQPDKAAFQKDPDGYIKQLMASRNKNDLDVYEDFADAILNKWVTKSPIYYGRLTLELCKPLSSGNFNDIHDVGLARKYALLALEKADEISLELELELTGHVMTHPGMRYSPKGQEFAKNRQKDCQIRLHAWQRLLDAIDPAWDPNDLPQLNVVPPEQTGLPSGVSPQAIENPVLRAEYEVAIEANRQKIEKYNEQYRLRGWLKRYPKQTEEYIIRAYSTAPYNNEELIQYLNEYKLDEETKTRIIDTVTKSIEKQKKLQK